jgi:hypothetical protein
MDKKHNLFTFCRSFIITGRLLPILIICSASLFGYHKIYKKRILNRDLLITGCARSGTGFISHLLQACKMQIGHEKTQKDGVSSWVMCTDAKHVPWAVDSRHKIRFSHIFHQVRHPLNVIASVQTEGEPSWKYILKHIPEIKKEDSRIVKCAKYWYYWNLKAEQQAEWTYQVEQIDQVWNEFCSRLGRKLNRSQLEAVPRNVNTRTHTEISWEDLKAQLDPELYDNIQKLAARYGYTI